MDIKVIPPELMPGNGEKLQQALKIRQQSADRETVAAKKAAREFEALFVGMMLKSMRATVGKDPLTGGGQGEEVYRSLLDQEYANSVVKSGGLGLAGIIEKQLIRQDKKVVPKQAALEEVL